MRVGKSWSGCGPWRLGFVLLVLHVAGISVPGLAAERCALPAILPAHAQPSEADYNRLGNQFREQNRFVCAVQAFQRATEMAPENAEYRYALGATLYEEGKLQAAEAALARAIELQAGYEQAHLALGAVEHDLGRTAAALEQWESVLVLDPDSEQAFHWIARTRIEARQYTAAIDLLRTAPEDEALAVDRLQAYSRSGMEEAGIAQATATLHAHPGWHRLDLALSLALTQTHRLQDASAALQRYLKGQPEDAEAQLQYLRVLVLMGAFPEAAALAKTYLQQHPADFDALYLSGLVQHEDGEDQAARQNLESAAKQKPEDYDVLLQLGMVEAKLGKAQDARERLTRAAALNPSAPEVHFQLAGVLRSLGETDAARREMASYQQGLQQRRVHDRDVSLSAEAAQKMSDGDASGAVPIYREIVVNEPGSAVAYYNLALALGKTSDRTSEREALESAVRLKPDLAEAQNQLGYLNANEGRAETAETCFRKAIAAAPQFAEAESNLGSLLASAGQERQAEQLFREAIAANPRYTDAWINLAATLASESKFAEARAAVLKALHVEPGSQAATELLAALPPAPLAEK